MKTLIIAAVLVAGVAFAQDPVAVIPTDGGAIGAVDVLSKPSATKTFLKNNWGKLLLGTGAAVTAVYLIEDSQDDDKPKAKASDKPAPAQPTAQPNGTSTSAGGDATVIVNNYNADDGGTITINNPPSKE